MYMLTILVIALAYGFGLPMAPTLVACGIVQCSVAYYSKRNRRALTMAITLAFAAMSAYWVDALVVGALAPDHWALEIWRTATAFLLGVMGLLSVAFGTLALHGAFEKPDDAGGDSNSEDASRATPSKVASSRDRVQSSPATPPSASENDFVTSALVGTAAGSGTLRPLHGGALVGGMIGASEAPQRDDSDSCRSHSGAERTDPNNSGPELTPCPPNTDSAYSWSGGSESSPSPDTTVY